MFNLSCAALPAFGALNGKQRSDDTPPITSVSGQPPKIFLHQHAMAALIRKGVLPKPADIDVNEQTLAFPNLPKPMEGCRIGHVSDLHATGRDFGVVGDDYYKRGFDKLADKKPDVLVFTGDAIHLTPSGIERARKYFKYLPKTDERYAILGNHDGLITSFWKHNAPDMASETATKVEAMLREEGFKVLRNDAAQGLFKGQPFTILGIDDVSGSNGVPDLEKTQRALEALKEKLPKGNNPFVLGMIHDPAVVDAWLAKGLPGDLFVAGHTHNGHHTFKKGGMVERVYSFLKNKLAFGEPKYINGLYALENGKQLHVSSGLALTMQPLRDHPFFTVPPFRVGQAPTMSVLTLTRSPNS